MESRHSACEPHEPGTPNGADAYQSERASFVTPAPSATAAAEAADLPRMMLVDERPLSAEDCAIGEVVAGKYLIEGVIGRGSMGVVVRATHLGFDELISPEETRNALLLALQRGIFSRQEVAEPVSRTVITP